MPNFIDLTGIKHGRLLPLKPVTQILSSGRRLVAWKCRCDCGSHKTVLATHLRKGATVSCGCYREEASRRSDGKPNIREWPEYGIYNQMRNRCENPNVRSWKYYGARGIRVCDRWRVGENGKTGFECFCEDMGPRPPNLTIDRIDNLGNYEPNNCRWATYQQQRKNQHNHYEVYSRSGKLLLSSKN